MTAKELMPGMKLYAYGGLVCKVLWTYRVGKWLKVVLDDARGRTHVVAKFPNSQIVTIGEEVHQP